MTRRCPTCSETMQERLGQFGPFLFCPNQYHCGQKTITVRKPDTAAFFRERHLPEPYRTATALESSMGGIARMAYENDREHEHTRDRASVDGTDVLFGGGMFCDMGMEDDDEDQRPW